VVTEKSLKNLKPIRTHKDAVSKGRKGGLVKSLRKDLARIINCNGKCPVYPCMFQPLSNQHKGKCALKQQTPTLQKKFYRICLGNEVEFLSMMGESLTKLVDSKDLIHYGEKVFRMKFGEKRKTELSGKVEFVDEMRDYLNMLKESEKVDKK